MSGSYVAGYVATPQTALFKDIPFATEHDLHVTVLYSKVEVSKDLLLELCKQVALPMKLKVVRAEIFDCLVEGVKSDTHGTVVLVVEAPILNHLHDAMVELGGEPRPYAYTPHVSLGYNVPLYVAAVQVAKINKLIQRNVFELQITRFFYESLDES